jgi:hypothetical protein
MATSHRTDAGKTGPVLNYLGHPCKLAQLIDARADEPDLDRYKGKDTRWLVQLLGDALATNETRVGNALTFAERVLEMAVEGADHTEIESMVDVLRDYLLHSSNHAYDTATLALAALHSADLIAPSQQQRAEVAHG